MRKNLTFIAGLALGLVALGFWHQFAPRHAPHGQSPLLALEPANFHLLEEAFDAARDSTRVLLLFSPT